ncbi:MAG TPA: alpha/beta fold hydrolase [Flavisolibacter sp.]|jgi:pimeloyl-ACP methyl ester carboxylesterase|nr:alpha/beta fold hydrolase [Flavisolibacter sp.]
MKHFLIVLLIYLLPGFKSEAQVNATPQLNSDRYALVDGHKMHYQTGGTGSATVVFENGHASTWDAWDNIYPQVGKFAKVFRYNRMGYGGSEPSEKPRTFLQIATELHELLQKANVPPPYVLAGHSMGGATIRAFASLYPQEMAGLVFVDPFNEYLLSGWTDDQKKQIGAQLDSSVKNAPPVVIAEGEEMKDEMLKGFPEINSFKLPDVPMVLLAANKDRPPTWEKSVADLFKNKMHDLSDSRFIDLPSSPHYIQNFEPSLVIECIRRVVFPNALTVLSATLKAKGVDDCIAHFNRLKALYPKEYISENYLNSLGYEQLNKGDAPGAIKLFALNAKLFPGSYNVYDSLGEANMKGGNKKDAIKNYQKSLTLNANNMNAERMLKKLNQ